MAVILLESDPFIEAVIPKDGQRYEQANVRRPLYGIATKSDRAAYLSVYQSNGGENLLPISLHDSSSPGGKSNANHNFIVQDIAQKRDEKVQIVETFGDHFAFFYGERPIILQISGLLMNTRDFNWKNEWLRNYDEFLRGTRCVENRARASLGFDDVVVQGYILNTGVQLNSDRPYIAPFVFQLLVTGYQDLSIVSDGGGGYVSEMSHARTLAAGDSEGQVVEYLTETYGGGIYEIDQATGESVHKSMANTTYPVSLTDHGTSTRTAFWLGDPNAPLDMAKAKDDALDYLDLTLAAQQNNTDALTARVARKNGATLPLQTRAAAEPLSTAFNGLANAAAVIEESPAF